MATWRYAYMWKSDFLKATAPTYQEAVIPKENARLPPAYISGVNSLFVRFREK